MNLSKPKKTIDASKNTPPEPEPENEGPSGLKRISDFLGIILLAGGLFNIPAILKKPETNNEWMMLTIVVTLIVAGGILIWIPGLLQKNQSK